MASFARALRLLDEVQNLEQLERFDGAKFSQALETTPAGEGFADLSGQLDEVRGLFEVVDRFAQKSMRIRLIHSGDALPQQFRTLLFSTITAYERDLPLLRGRVGGALSRIDRDTAAGVTDRVMDAAEQVLAARATLRQAVHEAAQRTAVAWLPTAQRKARDRAIADEERQNWGRARVDLERLAARGDAIEAGSFAERLAKIEAPPDQPEEEGADRFSLIEID